MPSLKALQVFEAAGRTSSFQKAAEELYVTPSAVSHQIKQLEEYLGMSLFERRTRKVTLTMAGSSYLEVITSAFMNMEVATGRLIEGRSGGELKLAVAPAFLDRWLLPRLNDFTSRYPDINLDIHSSLGALDFSQTDIDLAVYFGDGQWSDVDITFLRPSFLIPVCSPTLLEQEPVMVPADLLKFRLLAVKKRPEEWKTWFQMTGTPFFPSQGTISFSNGLNTAKAAAKGMGLALSDPSLVSEEIESGELMIPIDVLMRLSKSFYLVSQKGKPLTHAITVFKDWIMERMAADMALASQINN